MNSKIKFGMMCAFGVIAPVALVTSAAAEEVAASTIKGYNVSFSGGGWSAADKARAALNSIKGVDKVMLSGMTAFVTTSGNNVKFTRGTVNKAFAKAGLKAEGVDKKEISSPKETYDIAISGGTWAQTNERLRADLEKLDEISAAFVNEGKITLLMASAGSFDKKKIGKITAERKSVIKTATKASSPL